MPPRELYEVLSGARADTTSPVHAGYSKGNSQGWISLCGVGARGLYPVKDHAGAPLHPYHLRREGDEQHCPRCEAAFRQIEALRQIAAQVVR